MEEIKKPVRMLIHGDGADVSAYCIGICMNKKGKRVLLLDFSQNSCLTQRCIERIESNIGYERWQVDYSIIEKTGIEELLDSDNPRELVLRTIDNIDFIPTKGTLTGQDTCSITIENQKTDLPTPWLLAIKIYGMLKNLDFYDVVLFVAGKHTIDSVSINCDYEINTTGWNSGPDSRKIIPPLLGRFRCIDTYRLGVREKKTFCEPSDSWGKIKLTSAFWRSFRCKPFYMNPYTSLTDKILAKIFMPNTKGPENVYKKCN